VVDPEYDKLSTSRVVHKKPDCDERGVNDEKSISLHSWRSGRRIFVSLVFAEYLFTIVNTVLHQVRSPQSGTILLLDNGEVVLSGQSIRSQVTFSLLPGTVNLRLHAFHFIPIIHSKYVVERCDIADKVSLCS
jgi:hypothetical protein